MRIKSLRIDDIKIIEPDCFADDRGTVNVIYSELEYKLLKINFKLEQINQGYSKKKNTLRGCHFQEKPYEQAKIISCNRGSVYSVAVDLRKKSITLGEWCGEYLSYSNQKIMYIPKGFAHGYVTLEDETILQYCVDKEFKREACKVLSFNDPIVNIVWPVSKEKMIISEKDKNGLDISTILKNIL